jgi:hypothetical protein
MPNPKAFRKHICWGCLLLFQGADLAHMTNSEIAQLIGASESLVLRTARRVQTAVATENRTDLVSPTVPSSQMVSKTRRLKCMILVRQHVPVTG